MKKFLGLAGVLGLATAVSACGQTKCDADMKGMQGYQEERSMGVRYFVQTSVSDGSNEALHTGVLRIQQDCLFVGDALVVWHADSRQLVPDLVAELKAGKQVRISLGGGGRSLEEDATTFPTKLQELCGATGVWYSSGELKRL